jgi:hypothetical protein
MIIENRYRGVLTQLRGKRGDTIVSSQANFSTQCTHRSMQGTLFKHVAEGLLHSHPSIMGYSHASLSHHVTFSSCGVISKFQILFLPSSHSVEAMFYLGLIN